MPGMFRRRCPKLVNPYDDPDVMGYCPRCAKYIRYPENVKYDKIGRMKCRIHPAQQMRLKTNKSRADAHKRQWEKEKEKKQKAQQENPNP